MHVYVQNFYLCSFFLRPSFDTILNQVAVQRKRPFVERVLNFWMLKRQSRNNVPLIRRLQAHPQPPKAKQTVSSYLLLLWSLTLASAAKHDYFSSRLIAD